MNDGFVRRGGWWVAGQFLLLLALAILGITGRAAATPLPLWLRWVWPAADCRVLRPRRGGGFGAEPDALSPAHRPDGIYPARHLRADPASALHGGHLRRRRLVAGLGQLAGRRRFARPGGFARRQGPPGRTLAATTIPGLRRLCPSRAPVHSRDLPTFRRPARPRRNCARVWAREGEK